jgi:hypothetical protein
MNLLIVHLRFRFSLFPLFFCSWDGPTLAHQWPAVPRSLGSAWNGPRGLRAGPGLAVRHGGPTQTGTKCRRACIELGLVWPGQIVLGPGGPFGHLYHENPIYLPEDSLLVNFHFFEILANILSHWFIKP